MNFRFAWQAWHLWHWAGSGGGLGLGLVGVTPRHFAWQAWDSVASTFVLRGRRGTLSHELSFCVAGVALMALGWLWWQAWAGIGRRDAAALYVAAVGLCRIHPPSFCVAGVVQGLTGHFALQKSVFFFRGACWLRQICWVLDFGFCRIVLKTMCACSVLSYPFSPAFQHCNANNNPNGRQAQTNLSNSL